MLEILQNFESTVGEAARLRPVVIVGTGAAAVGIGLCVWLCGLGLRKPLVAIAGATTGGVLGLVLLNRGVVVPIVSAVAAAVLARVFEKVFITVLGAALAASIGFAVLAGPYIESRSGPAEVPDRSPAAGRDGASARTGGDVAGMEEFRTYAVDVGGRIKQSALLMPVQKWAIIVLPAVIFLAGGLVFWRPTAALGFSLAGTILVFAGMITLLVYKEAAPASQISSRPAVYAGVFAAMVIFGAVEQLLLCRGAKKQAARPEKPKGKSRRA